MMEATNPISLDPMLEEITVGISNLRISPDWANSSAGALQNCSLRGFSLTQQYVPPRLTLTRRHYPLMPRCLKSILSNAPAPAMQHPVYLFNLHYAREAAAKPAIVFARFTELPTEIRWKIWGFICEQPRDVRVVFKDISYICTSPDPEPPAFNVYREARRHVVDKYVSGCFELGPRYEPHRPIYVNLRVDTIFIYGPFFTPGIVSKLCSIEQPNDLVAAWKTVKMSAGRAQMVYRDEKRSDWIWTVVVVKNLKDSDETHMATHLARIGNGRKVDEKEFSEDNDVGDFMVIEDENFKEITQWPHVFRRMLFNRRLEFLVE